MTILRRAWRAAATLLAFGAAISTAHAQDRPPVLGQTALVVCIHQGNRDPVCRPRTMGGHQHSHSDFDKWKLKPGKSKFKINKRLLDRKKWFFDLSWTWFNEMQDPKLFVINPDKDPLSLKHLKPIPDAPDQSNPLIGLRIDDFIFVFGIHLLENSDKSKTPHALIYIPDNRENAGGGKGTHYSLNVFHIPDEDRDCRYEELPLFARHCLLLRKLARLWAEETPDEAFVEAVQKAYHDLTANIWYCVKDPPADPGEIDPCPLPHPGSHIPPSMPAEQVEVPPSPEPASMPFAPWLSQFEALVRGVMEIRMHNGVVHGKLF